MKFVGNIASDSEVVATASGAITAGKPVMVNSDGTVSEVKSANLPASAGSPVVFESATTQKMSVIFDSNSNKVVIAYQDGGNSNYSTAIVGTVSGTSISFGSPTVFESATSNFNISGTFDSNSNKVVIAYQDSGNSSYGTAIVGTVSGTSISFGSAAVFESANINTVSTTFDSNSNKVVIAYRDTANSNYSTAIVGTVSGTSISFGSATVFESAVSNYKSAIFDSSSNKVVIAYQDVGNSSYGTAIVGTVSGTSISFGSAVVFESASSTYISATFDSSNNKAVIAYSDGGNSSYGTAIIGTVSGTSISFGTPVVFESASADTTSTTFDSNTNKVNIAYRDIDNSYYGTTIVGTVSGTSISFGSPIVFESALSNSMSSTFDSNNNKVVVGYSDGGNSNYGTAFILTTENFVGFIGFAKDNVADGAVATIQTANSIARDNIGEAPTLSAGSAAVYESATASQTNIAFVPSANKFVIVYQDEGNSSYGTAVVATISGTSVTYGSPTVFNSDYVGNLDITVDTNVDRIAISWSNSTSANAGKMIIGAVSGTSLSFGSAADFNDNTVSTGVAFDSSNNKVVVAYEDDANSDYTAARVATIDSSDNSVTFGTEVNVEEANTAYQRIVFDSNSNKVVVAYRHYDGSAYSGRAKVGTVSGTNISFGSSTTFHSGNFSQPDIEFDSSNNKVVIVYANEASSAVGTAIVGTVSGTSISFGSAVVFNNGDTSTMGLTFNTTQNHFVIAYRDQGDSNKLNAIIGIVDGTSISFGTEASLTSGAALWIKCAYDSNADKVLVSYQDGANSDYGTAIVATASTDLTIGQTYFVQTDGTLSTSADSPSVIAGTAISSTDLIVKG